ncbi:MAG: helix-turn-helix domain-containing protein [Firmicutes bacterium]|nr:helix-turn-helix domain-containing protein [Bacillota bacterium]MCL5063500.1 helix-turn-helix domain-containing protein [Bacillota bacterium]
MNSTMLAKFRQAKGLTQFELAKRANVGQSVISAIETGKIWPYPKWRKRLANALGVDEEDVFPGLDVI